MLKLKLIIESEQGRLNGRVTYNDNLIVDCAESLPELEERLKVLLHDFKGLQPNEIEFLHSYDVAFLPLIMVEEEN